MNAQEFKHMLQDIAVRWPDDFEWMEKHPDMVQLWLDELFGKLQLSTCMEVIKEVSRGLIPKWQPYERSQIGTIISREARRREWDAANRRQVRAKITKEESGKVIAFRDRSMNECLVVVRAIQSAGASPRDVAALIDDWFEGRDVSWTNRFLGTEELSEPLGEPLPAEVDDVPW